MFEEAEEIAKDIYIHHFDDDINYPDVLKMGYAVEFELTTSQLVAAKLTADATAINVIVLQAQKYDTARGYEHVNEFTAETLANIKTETVKVGEDDVNVIAHINALIDEIIIIAPYIYYILL